MFFIYTLSIHIYVFLIRVASLFNEKARKWIVGGKNIFEQITSDLKKNPSGKGNNLIWFHCASLGEFEQGRPIMETFRKKVPYHKLLLSFFSPSGYEGRKNYPGADHIFYLPADTRRN